MRHPSPSRTTKNSPFETRSPVSQEPNVVWCESESRAFHYSLEDDSVQDDSGMVTLTVSHLCQLQQGLLQQQPKRPTLNPFRWQEIVDKDQSPSLVGPISPIKRLTQKRATVPQQQEKKDLLKRWESDYEEHDCYSHLTSQTTKQNHHRWESQARMQLVEKQTLMITELLAPQHEQGRLSDKTPNPPRRQESNPSSLF
ncbi:hypothetical protein IV203_014207 [Nitzschia inconspicua]|nr:hypothetical protein IV203_014207 [Nitzschia inconspicua]